MDGRPPGRADHFGTKPRNRLKPFVALLRNRPGSFWFRRKFSRLMMHLGQCKLASRMWMSRAVVELEGEGLFAAASRAAPP